MFAIVKSGGKQFKVQVGATIDVEKLDGDEGAQVRLDQVLLAAHDGDVAFGHPLIDGAVVTATVTRQHKGPKLIVFRYKSKSRYRRRTGHRQRLTRLTIQTIEVPGWEVARVEAIAQPQAGSAEATPIAQGSAAPPNDVLPVLAPAAQVAAPEAEAVEPVTGTPLEPPVPEVIDPSTE